MDVPKVFRIILFADTHLGFDYPVRPRVRRRRRGDDFFQNFHRILQYAELKKADLVVHGGDLFFRSKVAAPIIDLAYRPLLTLARKRIPVFIVPGNHERSRLPQQDMLHHPYLHVFDRPRTFALQIKGIKVSVSGFPFQRGCIQSEYAKLVEASRWRTTEADFRLLCFHQTVEGAQVGPSDYTFVTGRDVIPFQRLTADFDLYLSGHIHRRQVLTSTQKLNSGIKVIYPGSIERTSFAEKKEPKGFFDIRVIANNARQWEIGQLKFVRLPARPMVDLVLDHSLTTTNLESFIRQKATEFQHDAVVRLRLKNAAPELKKQITGQWLRQLLPKTMNVQYGLEFRQSAPDHRERSVCRPLRNTDSSS